MISLTELKEKEHVTAEEVVSYIEQQAQNGASIDSTSIIQLLDRSEPTENVSQVVRIRVACELAASKMQSEQERAIWLAILAPYPKLRLVA